MFAFSQPVILCGQLLMKESWWSTHPDIHVHIYNPPLDCGLDLMTCFLQTDYRKSDVTS